MQTYRGCALIGTGYWGSKLQCYIEESPELHLHQVANSTTDLNTIWEDETIEAVVIATPIDTHATLTLDALSAGKHVLVEKPLSTSPEECRTLQAIARSQGLTLLVDYVQCFATSILVALDHAKRSIGNVKYIEAETSHLGRYGMGFDVYWLLASHWLSVIDMIQPLDRYEWVSRDLLHNPTDRLATTGEICGYTISGEPWATIRVSTDTPGKRMAMTIYGSNGCLQWDGVNQPTITQTLHTRKPKALPQELTHATLQEQHNERDNLRSVVRAFADCINFTLEGNSGRAVRVTAAIDEATGGTYDNP